MTGSPAEYRSRDAVTICDHPLVRKALKLLKARYPERPDEDEVQFALKSFREIANSRGANQIEVAFHRIAAVPSKNRTEIGFFSVRFDADGRPLGSTSRPYLGYVPRPT